MLLLWIVKHLKFAASGEILIEAVALCGYTDNPYSERVFSLFPGDDHSESLLVPQQTGVYGRRVRVIFQDRDILEIATVREYLDSGLALAGIEPAAVGPYFAVTENYDVEFARPACLDLEIILRSFLAVVGGAEGVGAVIRY